MPPPDKKRRLSPRLLSQHTSNTSPPPPPPQPKPPSKPNHKSKHHLRKIQDLYDLRDEIGSGTCGKVRRAIHRQTGRMVAVKIISLQRGANCTLRSGLPSSSSNNNNANNHNTTITLPTDIQSEATILQSLAHPHIAPLLDCFVHPNTAVYLVMELLAGGDRIVQRGKYTKIRGRRVMRRILVVVHYLHVTQGIVHRDLKPENILCVGKDNDATVKLTDFGLAKNLVSGGDGCKTFCGTPQYFAPEVLILE